MSESSLPDKSSRDLPEKPKSDLNTRWAADRTLWAADRTFIAWLRTSISMIGFGITIGKGGEVLESQGIAVGAENTTQYLGVIFILLACLGLAGALVQNVRIDQRLKREGYPRVEPTPLALTMGILVTLFGLAGALFVFF